MLADAQNSHSYYHTFSYCNVLAVAASTLFLTQRHALITLTASLVLQGAAVGLDHVKIRRVKKGDFIRPIAWHSDSRLHSKQAHTRMKLSMLAAIPLCLIAGFGGATLAFTTSLYFWGERRYQKAIKKKMIKVLKLHEINEKTVHLSQVTRKIRKVECTHLVGTGCPAKLKKIRAKLINNDTWNALKKLPELRNLRVGAAADLRNPPPRLEKYSVNTFLANGKLAQVDNLAIIVVRDPQLGWQYPLVDNTRVETIVIKKSVIPDHVKAILDGKHIRLRTIELPAQHVGMKEICEGSAVWVSATEKEPAKIVFPMR